MKQCLVNIDEEKGTTSVQYEGAWRRMDVEMAYNRMLKALPAYLQQRRLELESKEKEG